MGASFNAISYTGTEKQMLKEWARDVDDAEYEHGHGGNYTGSISELGHGVQVSNKVFNSYDEASEYILDHHNKWDGAMGVRYYKKGGLNKSSANKKEKLQEKVSSAEKYRDNLANKMVSDIKNAKSKFIGCNICGSKINRKYITHNGTCPLCATSFLSPTAKKRISVANEKVIKARKDLSDYKPTLSKTAKATAWLVGGWCSS